jgi:hypothetical protein
MKTLPILLVLLSTCFAQEPKENVNLPARFGVGLGTLLFQTVGLELQLGGYVTEHLQAKLTGGYIFGGAGSLRADILWVLGQYSGFYIGGGVGFLSDPSTSFAGTQLNFGYDFPLDLQNGIYIDGMLAYYPLITLRGGDILPPPFFTNLSVGYRLLF